MTQNEKKTYRPMSFFRGESRGTKKKKTLGKVRPLLIFPRIKYDSIFFLDFFFPSVILIYRASSIPHRHLFWFCCLFVSVWCCFFFLKAFAHAIISARLLL
jgi:hypothetical protein